jgi:hypothetical protein
MSARLEDGNFNSSVSSFKLSGRRNWANTPRTSIARFTDRTVWSVIRWFPPGRIIVRPAYINSKEFLRKSENGMQAFPSVCGPARFLLNQHLARSRKIADQGAGHDDP